MKKRIIALIVLIIFATIYSCLAVGCTLGYEKASEQRFVEYFDKNGKIYFKTVGGMYGVGYLVLNGKKIEAEYELVSVGGQGILVHIPKDEDPRIGKSTNRTYASDYFDTSDLNEQNQITTSKEVVLFGENFGQIVLTMNQLTKEDFEVWEMSWDVQMIDDWELFSLSSVGLRGQGTNGKPVAMTVWRDMYSYRASEMESFFFVWLPEEKGFEIYTKEEDQYEPTEGQQPIATGTYVLQDDVVTLAFVTDELFYGAYPTVELTLNVN